MKKKYLMLPVLAMVFVLAASLANVVQSQVTYTDAVKINLLTNDRGLPDTGGAFEGIYSLGSSYYGLVLPFAFSPRQTFTGVTEFWITIVAQQLYGRTVTFTLNGVSTSLEVPYIVPEPATPMVYSTRITATPILQAVVVGINNATLTVPFGTMFYLYGVDIFIEYQYSGAAAAVGGIVIPVDKLGLLAPYITLVAAMVTISVGTVYAWKRWFRKAVV